MESGKVAFSELEGLMRIRLVMIVFMAARSVPRRVRMNPKGVK